MEVKKSGNTEKILKIYKPDGYISRIDVEGISHDISEKAANALLNIRREEIRKPNDEIAIRMLLAIMKYLSFQNFYNGNFDLTTLKDGIYDIYRNINRGVLVARHCLGTEYDELAEKCFDFSASLIEICCSTWYKTETERRNILEGIRSITDSYSIIVDGKWQEEQYRDYLFLRTAQAISQAKSKEQINRICAMYKRRYLFRNYKENNDNGYLKYLTVVTKYEEELPPTYKIISLFNNTELEKLIYLPKKSEYLSSEESNYIIIGKGMQIKGKVIPLHNMKTWEKYKIDKMWPLVQLREEGIRVNNYRLCLRRY